jgi:uncharacterized protein YegL
MSNRPGGEIATRPLNFIWICDCSGSMQGQKIGSLNSAIQNCIKPMQDVAAEHVNAQILVRAVKFSDGAQWHISQPTEIKDFKWADVSADGVTDMGKALTLVADALKIGVMPERGLPPVLVLMTDGHPTDDVGSGLKALMAQPWGKKAVRIGIAIGDDADIAILEKFMDNRELKPLVARTAAQLVTAIKWASTVPLKAASNPASQTTAAETGKTNVPIPAPPPDDPNLQVAATDVF